MQLADGVHPTTPETRSCTISSFNSDCLSLSASYNLPLQYPEHRNVALYVTWSSATWRGGTHTRHSGCHYSRFQVLFGKVKRAFTSTLQVSPSVTRFVIEL